MISPYTYTQMNIFYSLLPILVTITTTKSANIFFIAFLNRHFPVKIRAHFWHPFSQMRREAGGCRQAMAGRYKNAKRISQRQLWSQTRSRSVIFASHFALLEMQRRSEMGNIWFFCKNGPTPASFSFIFGIFKQTTIQILKQINVKNVHPVYGTRIRTHDLSNMSRHP